jgi:hypothetical protein
MNELSMPLDHEDFEMRMFLIFAGNEITENLIIVEDDVDYLWNKGVSVALAHYAHFPEKYYNAALKGNDLRCLTISTEDLPSKRSKSANAKKSASINIGMFDGGNEYYPEKAQIFLSLDKESILLLGPSGFKNQKVIEIYQEMEEKFSREKFQATIAHELTHWLGYALQSEKLLKFVKKIEDKEKSHFSYHEIDAYINSISLFKKSFSDSEWNKMSFLDMMRKNSSFIVLLKKARELTVKEYVMWNRLFFERLSREKILGRNMYPLSSTELTKAKL